MATLTYVFEEGTVPSAKDTIVSEEAVARNLIVSEVPDVYPGLAGELEISGSPQILLGLLEEAAEANAPGHATRLKFTDEEACEVEAHFKGFPIQLEKDS